METLQGFHRLLYLIHHTRDEFVSDSIANRNDECIDDMEQSYGKCKQTHLLPAQHPAVQPIREAPGTCKSEVGTLHSKNCTGSELIIEVIFVLV